MVGRAVTMPRGGHAGGTRHRAVLFLPLAGILIGLVLAEAMCRLVEAVGCIDHDEVIWEPNRFYGWGLVPGTSGWAQPRTGTGTRRLPAWIEGDKRVT